MAKPVLRVLSAGAAKGLVQALAGPFEAERNVRIDATFDSAGAIANGVRSAGPCDLVILTAGGLDTLCAEGLVGEPVGALGRVPTGIAVAAGDAFPDVGDADALRASLLAAPALYCPDTVRATAGIHFAGVLRTLGIAEEAAPRLRAYPNGAQAMAALAADGPRGAIGCTQITEILYTKGVALVAELAPPFALATVYGVAVATRASSSAQARAFAERLTGTASRDLRRAGGFLDRG